MWRSVFKGVLLALCLAVWLPSLLALYLPPVQMNALASRVSVPHAECPLCGMTRGYCRMAQGEFRKAWEHNRGAPGLFLFGLAAGTAAWGYLGSICLRKRR